MGNDRGRTRGREDLAGYFRKTAPISTLMERLSAGAKSLLLEGMAAPATSLLALAVSGSRTAILLVGSQEAGERAADALSTFLALSLASSRTSSLDSDPETDLDHGRPWYLFGHSSAFLEDGGRPGSSSAIADRLSALDCLSSGGRCLLVSTLPGLLQYTYAPDEMRGSVIRVECGQEMNLEPTLHHLVRIGYERADMVQGRGEFAARGGILDVFPTNDSHPIRIDLFGDQIESVRTFDPISQRSTGTLRGARILPACEPLSARAATLLDYLPADCLLLVDDASALRRRWDEFEGEVQDELQAFLAGSEERTEATDKQRVDDLKGDSGVSKTSASTLPFCDLEQAAPRLESFQTVFLNHLSRTVPWGRPDGVLSLTCEPAPRMEGDVSALGDQLRSWEDHGVRSWLFSHQWPRLAELLRARGREIYTPPPTNAPRDPDADAPAAAPPSPIEDPPLSVAVVAPGTLWEGFFIPAARLAVLSDNEIFGGIKMRRSRRTSRESTPLVSLLELKIGDLVVHVDHGIGVFRGLKSMDVEGVRRDYLQLEYAQGDKLFVPSDQIARVQRYIGSEDHPPAIHRLGGQDWSRTKRRVREAVENMARELLALYAARSTRDGHAYGPDSPWQAEMEAAFVYEETGDQLKAIADVKDDLESDKPMDRLICGDVGYGKTEVAIRAAFKVVMEGKQVAVLVPTTVLAQQHLNTFTERLSGFPVTIEMLSRFRSRKEQLTTVEGLKAGRVDIVIGTHRLLSKDVDFKNLGLVVVDEEQRFGVGHKEKLKQLRKMVDVLTLTATPIPRTLHMAMSTIRDMSVMNEAPEGRTSIRTYLREASDDLVRQCILRELERDGQVYFVHNRVENMPHILQALRELVPQARIAMGHGQMPEHDLEQVMLDFYDRQYDVLCCTTIIESGLDIPNVNTIVINDADRLGLAQLYQLRGRVGRSNRQAYCFLLFKPDKEMTETAQKRLNALREFSDLGSGFRIALRDLEIRGAGNLLGAEQHGALMSVGFDLYCQMIADAVRTLKNEPPPPPPLPPVDLPLAAHIPETYVPAESLRLEFYKRFSAAGSADDLVAIQDELQDRFGQFPLPVRHLLAVLRLRLQSREIGVTSINSEGDQVVIRLGPRLRLTPQAILSLQSRHRGVRFLTDRVVIPVAKLGALSPVTAVMESLQAIRNRRQ